MPNLRWFFSAIQFILRSVKYNCVLWFNIASCDLYIILYHIILYYIIYYIILYLYYIILYYIILHSVILYCVIWNKITSHGFICAIQPYIAFNEMILRFTVYIAQYEFIVLPEKNAAQKIILHVIVSNWAMSFYIVSYEIILRYMKWYWFLWFHTVSCPCNGRKMSQNPKCRWWNRGCLDWPF